MKIMALIIIKIKNHIHLLISLSTNHALSDLLRELKKASSHWIKSKEERFKNFQWQSGFGAFSIGQSQIETVKNYIAKQKSIIKPNCLRMSIESFWRNTKLISIKIIF